MTGRLVWGHGFLGRILRSPDVRGWRGGSLKKETIGTLNYCHLLWVLWQPWSDASQTSMQPLPLLSLLLVCGPQQGVSIFTILRPFFVLLAGARFVSKLVSELPCWTYGICILSCSRTLG